MEATVVEALDDLVTLKVIHNPTGAKPERFRGGRIVIEDDLGEKGEVAVADAATDADGTLYLFGRLFQHSFARPVRVGDRAR